MLNQIIIKLFIKPYLTRLKPCWDSTSLLQKGSGQGRGELHDVVIQYNTYYIKKKEKHKTNSKQK